MSAPAPTMFSPFAAGVAKRMGLQMGKANLEVFAETLIELAEQDSSIVAVTSDSRGSGKLIPFAQKFPRQLVEVGIAEQNLVGVTAGLAACGKRSFGVSPSCFLTTRSLEQIKNDVCYSNVPATLVGISAGVSYGALGTTHHSLCDLAALRAINNLTIVVPADNFEARQAVCAAAKAGSPYFIRFGKVGMYHLHNERALFKTGKALTIREGSDVFFIATGEAVIHAALAAGDLEMRGLSAKVISVHTVKPLDIEAILQGAKKCKVVITVEEHMVHGGLGEACASALLQGGISKPFRIVGIPDEETITGSQADIFRHYGISMEGLTGAALSMLNQA